MNENSKEKENSNISKDIPSQIHSNEPPIAIFNKLNSIAKGNFHQIIPLLVCEICYKDQNLIQCKICKNGFHKKCLNIVFLPENFICSNCKNQFTEEEIKDKPQRKPIEIKEEDKLNRPVNEMSLEDYLKSKEKPKEEEEEEKVERIKDGKPLTKNEKKKRRNIRYYRIR